MSQNIYLDFVPVMPRKESAAAWRCVYCGEDLESKIALKIHFNGHKDKIDYNINKICSCGKYFSEFHYFENHLLQTGHMNATITTKYLNLITPQSQSAFNTVLSTDNNNSNNNSYQRSQNDYKALYVYGMVGTRDFPSGA